MAQVEVDADALRRHATGRMLDDLSFDLAALEREVRSVRRVAELGLALALAIVVTLFVFIAAVSFGFVS